MNNSFIVNLGQRIKKMRVEKGVSQKDLANKMGIPVSTLANYEAGRREIPVELFERVPELLNCKIRDILPEMMYHSKGRFYFFFDEENEISLETKDYVDTIAGRDDNEKWTSEELKQIEQFKQFLLSKREK